MVKSRAKVSGRAFALLDVLIGGVLLGIALAVILGLSGQSLTAQTRGEQMQQAARLADQLLSMVLSVGPEAYMDRFPMRGQGDEVFEGYAWELEIQDMGQSRPFDVRATVWYGPSSTPTEDAVIVETRIAAHVDEDPELDRAPEEPVVRQ